ncbi:hypothetical protein DLAC_05932 [Tieghemostelium lacteum]|uniref:Uncharacterized protein n=1 Tax=Tieghemostelium lacteum TaxID=361077 RepID=A0A151ZH24_TIELA|nr:hypothetical protein DLAC_05932 [Tieghemostelium lacteum]|eukprot:KYQ93273.1 hypothetical protein DLAC_05932 [Tieghemostelium lacteum]
MTWVILKDNFNILENKRVHYLEDYNFNKDYWDANDNSSVNENPEDLNSDELKNLRGGAFTFKCVTTYDSGLYYLKQKSAFNTGFNKKTLGFNLTIQGENSETLVLVKEPAKTALSGQNFAVQPIIGYGRVEGLKSYGNIEPFIAKGPFGSKRNFIFSDQTPRINETDKTVHFGALTIIGVEGDYVIGFVDADTCEIVLVPFTIEIVYSRTVLFAMFGLALLISLLISLLSTTLYWFVNFKFSTKPLVTLWVSIQVPMAELIRKKGEALKMFFKFQHLLVLQSFIFAALSAVLLLPVTIKGDNDLYDIYRFSQANWNTESSYLYIYQVALGLLFVLYIFIYTRFNEERIFLSYDENHLVTERSVMLTGLPKSLIDCTILKEFLQTGYSKGIYSLSIILEKQFSNQDIVNDIKGDPDLIEDVINSEEGVNRQISSRNILENVGTILSSRTAFITFSCVSDAHLFKTQFSPMKWSWAKSISPVPPQDYKYEMNIKDWKAYEAPRLFDILWTKFHNPANYHKKYTTIILMIVLTLVAGGFSYGCAVLFSQQFSSHAIDIHSDAGVVIWVYLIYSLIPAGIILTINKLIPIFVKKIFDKSSIFVRSDLKVLTLIYTFVAQAISIVVAPTLSFIADNRMNPTSDYANNSFFYPINFMKSGGFFYSQFVILYSILTPFIDTTNFFTIMSKLLKKNKKCGGKDQKQPEQQENDFLFNSSVNLTTHYSNTLLLVLIVSCYGIIFPLLFVLLFIYCLVKYHFIKYVAVTTKTSVPKSDTYLVCGVQRCIWIIITLTFSFHFIYVIQFERYDVMLAYIFMLVIGFGRYIPSFSQSVCYTFCDGAVFPISSMFSKSHQDIVDEYSDDEDEKLPRDSSSSSSSSSDDENDIVVDVDDNQQDHPYVEDSKFDEIIRNEDDIKPMRQKQNLKQTILRLKQSYWSKISGTGMFSFSSLYKLPQSKPITIITYSSPFYKLACSECVISQDDEEFDKPYTDQDSDQDENFDDFD